MMWMNRWLSLLNRARKRFVVPLLQLARAASIYLGCRTILLSNTKTSLGGSEPADDQRFPVISYQNHKMKKALMMRKSQFSFTN